ncbi:hypothetical protein IUY40_09285 [Flavobacterium sp. ALJ2]|uniref:hypothetical protein n=1 Tax=Flavobacterium sp. ALJ2 TaxID=2786960 RepID=UPI00189FD584|nr:hypothetical protein [Flavobacterium sp. ALJ2]MBF7091734.1 hypothetical protein [Flavobacterium sp. ALJ2]
MTFEITHKISTIVNDNAKEIQTSFNVEFLALEKKSNFNTYEISKTKVINTPSHKNSYLTFLENLEQLTYPIKIQTTSQGEFVKLIEYREWLERWEENTAILMEEYDGNENAKDILEKFNINVYDEQIFMQNKFKEPFWNLIFFNPKIEDDEQSNNITINWNLKSIGNVECTGKTKFVKSDTGESLLCFESQDVINEGCTEIINFITSNKANQNEYMTKVKAITALDTSHSRVKYKSAIFEIQKDTSFHYKEEIFLNIRREINSK